jgi:hypothetical protein
LLSLKLILSAFDIVVLRSQITQDLQRIGPDVLVDVLNDLLFHILILEQVLFELLQVLLDRIERRVNSKAFTHELILFELLPFGVLRVHSLNGFGLLRKWRQLIFTMVFLVRSEGRRVFLHFLLSSFLVRRLFKNVRDVPGKLANHFKNDVLNNVSKPLPANFQKCVWLLIVFVSVIFGVSIG